MKSIEEGNTQIDDDDDSSNPAAGDAIYTASDTDGLQVSLTLMGADGPKFELSTARVLSFKMKPDYEMPADANRDNVYEVTVRASDGTLYADRMVKVTVTDDDEEPVIMGKDAAISYAEGGKDAVATFTAEDPEGVTPITWSIPTGDPDGGAGDLEATDNIDSDFFEIDKDGMLKFKSSPDYEASETGDGGADAGNDNTYLVVVAATDATDNTGYHKVTVKVTEVAETGKVTWTTTPKDGNVTTTPLVQFQVDTALTVAETGGVTDKDVRGAAKEVTESLQWYRSTSKTGTGTAIENATSPEYTVTTTDVGKYIRVEARYTVGQNVNQESASLTSDYPVLGSRSSNEEPEFSPAAVTREVSEGKKGMNVGAPVTATDDIANALTYALMTDGDDDGKFKIDPKTGQITTRFDLNREATTPATATAAGACAGAEMKECTVTVTATDSAGAPTAPAATVTIKITNVDEKPTFITDTNNGTPPAASPKAITSPENSDNLYGAVADGFPVATTAVDVTYAATDPEDLNVNLTLMGPDGAKFSLSSDGELSFRTKPDYEMPADANKDNVYEVTVRASDGTLFDDRMVKVTVTPVDEAPEIIAGGLAISGRSSVSYAEDSTTTTVGTYTARGENPAGARWTLEGADRGDFSLSTSSGASVMLRFRSAPDYERPADAGTNNVYEVTLKATEGDEHGHA